MAQAMFIELGMGVDLQGQDTTKAATRAVRDAIGRNYLPGVRRMLEASGGRMLVHVRLGVPAEAVQPDLAAVRATLPYGEVTVEVAPGGMLVPNGLDDGGRICVVNAAVEVAVDTAATGRPDHPTRAGDLVAPADTSGSMSLLQ